MENNKDNSIKPATNTQNSISQKNEEIISFFEKDESFVFVYKKTEKLATALYMVTNLFSDSEPMKWTLRKKVSELLSFMVGYKNILPAQYSVFTNDIKTQVLEIVSLLEISYRSGLVSPMNFSILKDEFSRLISVIDNDRHSHSEPHYQKIPNSFFNVPNQTNNLSNTRTNGPLDIGQDSHNDIKDIKENRNVFKKNNRQNIIIQLLKKKKDLTIKDISQTIRDCSEKTIQRELIELINNGIIRKTGERRWSRYSLINN